MKVLVVAAHPDDEILGMGGTILRHTSNGDNLKIIYLATGISSREKYEGQLKNKSKIDTSIKNLRKNAEKAANSLGVKKIKFFDFPDNEMDAIPLLMIIKVIENEIKKFNPEIIYTNHFGDLNVDHRATYNATLTACRPINNQIKELITFEVPSSTEWNYPNKFNPNYFVNIEKQLSKKIKAFSMFKSESRKFPHPRSETYLKHNAGKWGGVSGNKSAEAFEIIRKINF